MRARLPKARLVLLGGGEPGYIEEIQNLARSLGLGDSVIFAGVRSNMQGFYDAMDAFLLPSLFEGLPVVLVEAQTAGLPCFVADTVDKGAAFTDRVHFCRCRMKPPGRTPRRGQPAPRPGRPPQGRGGRV